MCKRNVSLMMTGVLIDGLVRCIVAIASWALGLVLSELVCRLQYLIVEARTCEVTLGLDAPNTIIYFFMAVLFFQGKMFIKLFR